MFGDRLNHNYFLVGRDSLDPVIDHLKKCNFYKTKKGYYYNIPCAFDIETTSFFVNAAGDVINTTQWAMLEDKTAWKKRACMYVWQLGLDGYCIVGRYWEEFETLLEIIADELELNAEKKIIIYVHNLSFEFQFLKMRFTWSKIFATKPYMPLYAVCDLGFEFRCSYRNTNKSLEEVGKDLLKYKVAKAVGDLDYNLLRHSGTPLTDAEINYCINDIRVVMAYIMEQIEIEGRIDKIPLTLTGYVRRAVKDKCFKDKDKKLSKLKRFKYRAMINKMTLDYDTYILAKKATLGGFTHANAIYAAETLHDMDGVDICSSYPTVMIAEQFPMTTPKKREIHSLEELEMYCKYYCCIFIVEYFDISSRFEHDSYISMSRCEFTDGAVNDNGRIRAADKIIMVTTNVDYWIIKKWYKYKRIRVKSFYTSVKDYLPKSIIESILDFYGGKTTLKGVSGRENDYMRHKGMLNSIYGMMLTSIINPEITLTCGEWDIQKLETQDIIDQIVKYNDSKSRFLYWLWGTFVTAYARRNVVGAILGEVKDDYVYCDTDSIKMYHYERHRAWFEGYNRQIQDKIYKCLDHYKIDRSRASPADQKGVIHPMGVFEHEGHYKRFKTLGAKRYMHEDEKGIHITVAGLGKKAGQKYLITSGSDPFELFSDDMQVEALETGKLTHTYIEDEHEGSFEDYQGNIGSYHELTAVNLAPCEFSLGLADEYIDLIKALKFGKFNLQMI